MTWISKIKMFTFVHGISSFYLFKISDKHFEMSYPMDILMANILCIVYSFPIRGYLNFQTNISKCLIQVYGYLKHKYLYEGYPWYILIPSRHRRLPPWGPWGSFGPGLPRPSFAAPFTTAMRAPQSQPPKTRLVPPKLPQHCFLSPGPPLPLY